MKFEDVLRDLSEHVIQEACDKYDDQRDRHDFKPFTSERGMVGQVRDLQRRITVLEQERK